MQSENATSTTTHGVDSANSTNSTATETTPSQLISQFFANSNMFSPLHSYTSTTNTTPLSQISRQFTPNTSPTTTTATYNNHQLYQDTINRHSLCLNHLREAGEEVASLRQEVAALRSANRELKEHLSLLVQEHMQKRMTLSAGTFDIVNSLQGLMIDGSGGKGSGGSEGPRVWEEECDESPTSVIEPKVDMERISLPKSISVRSSGYLKVVSQGSSSRPRNVTRPRAPVTLSASAQKVYVKGGKKEEELELEVYNQGMYKTELCNKWQETGGCPYGEHCQFAHGIEELRPVIRHPRYKTEVCRMVLAGVLCPYGHRCHFRHALTEEERMMGPFKPAAGI